MKKLRTKSEILGTLADVVTENDKKIAKAMYHASGLMVKNSKPTDMCNASYVGWARNEKGDLLRIEGEPRGEGATASLTFKVVTVPNITGVDLGLDEPKGEDFRKNKGVNNFFDM
jgi:hypothetical protein